MPARCRGILLCSREDRRPVELMAEDGGLDRVLEASAGMSRGIPS